MPLGTTSKLHFTLRTTSMLSSLFLPYISLKTIINDEKGKKFEGKVVMNLHVKDMTRVYFLCKLKPSRLTVAMITMIVFDINMFLKGYPLESKIASKN